MMCLLPSQSTELNYGGVIQPMQTASDRTIASKASLATDYQAFTLQQQLPLRSVQFLRG
jgi:hypothetical protein